jgi:hypothetical protein
LRRQTIGWRIDRPVARFVATRVAVRDRAREISNIDI